MRPAPPVNSLLLDQLPSAIRQRFLSLGEPVALPLRTPLYSPGQPPRHVHVVTSGIVSIVTPMSTGDSAEIALIGREGIPEALHLLGPTPGVTECFVQVEATALRFKFERFQKEFLEEEAVRDMVLRCVQYSTQITGQIAACNRLHEVEERLARWLLMVADRVESSRFYITQEFLAQMLGSRRSTVTLTAGALKRSGLITYQRGNIEIIDREGLEDSACECYSVTRTLFKGITKRA